MFSLFIINTELLLPSPATEVFDVVAEIKLLFYAWRVHARNCAAHIIRVFDDNTFGILGGNVIGLKGKPSGISGTHFYLTYWKRMIKAFKDMFLQIVGCRIHIRAIHVLEIGA